MTTQAKLFVHGNVATIGVLNAMEAEMARVLVRTVPGVRLLDRARFQAEGYELLIPYTAWMVAQVHAMVHDLFGGYPAAWQKACAMRAPRLGPRVYPRAQLRDYQQEAVDFILAARSGVILGDQMGLGKTRTAAAAARLVQELGGGREYFKQGTPGGDFEQQGVRYDRPIFIMAPKYLRETWRTELVKIGALQNPEDFAVAETRSPHTVDKKSGMPRYAQLGGGQNRMRRFYFVHYDVVEAWWPWLWPLKPAAVIMDEAHFLKNSRTKRARGAALAASTTGKTILLTGTPIENRAGELWNLLGLAAGQWTFGTPLEFRQRYMGAVHTGFAYEDQAPTHTEELQARLTTCYLRRTLTDVALELPPITREVVSVELDPKQAARYGKLLDGYTPEAVFDAIMRGALGAQALKMFGKARKLTSAAKKAATVAEAQSALDQGENVVVFTWERKTAEQIAAKLRVPGRPGTGLPHEHDARVVHGGIHQDVRDVAISRFQDFGGCLVATQAALGVGVNLQRARVVIMHDLDWTPAKLLQAEARVWRGGQTQNVISKWMIAEGTLDALIARAIVKKADVIGALLDDHEPAQLADVFEDIAAPGDVQDYAARWAEWRQL